MPPLPTLLSRSPSEQTKLAHGYNLGAANGRFGELRRSDQVVADVAELRRRIAADGYLYLPGFFETGVVEAARRQFIVSLAKRGLLDSRYPPDQAVKDPDADLGFLADPVKAMEYMTALAKSNAPLQQLLYAGKILRFFEGFFEDDVRHYDFTWVRTMGKGFGTDPHCDIVYMGRGSSRVCTVWTPFGDLSYEIGGLMILEGSHEQASKLSRYLSRDVDKYCGNRPEAEEIKSGKIPWTWGGVLSTNPDSLRERLGGRWLSAEFRRGDVLIFGMKTVHASLDNQTPYFRISTDTRYQPASDPIDERWIGANPVGHGLGAKRPMIC
ncbi:MAG TPA: phytanoyl-CoA dioxygenase family protein [Lacunisphaera sp.]|nr:phytanoyl-CoA dioxygenase family protein [Lacunisphaera sp.]